MVENRVLSIAGYLYGLNTLCLTFRVFGHVMEQSEGVGTIQIALFRILKDVGTIVWQFIAVILAFSIATTKVYVVETSFLASGSGRNDTLVYISIRAIVIYLDFCSTRRALDWLILGHVALIKFKCIPTGIQFRSCCTLQMFCCDCCRKSLNI